MRSELMRIDSRFLNRPTILQVPLLAELRTKHARNQATDWFCFPLTTGTCGIQGDLFRDRPTTAIGEFEETAKCSHTLG